VAGKDLSLQGEATYKMLRIGLALLAFALPPLLWLGGSLLGHLPLASSMSAYYHVSDPLNMTGGPAGQGVMRNEFVGVLFAVSGFLLAYQGFTKLEDYALNLAGALAVGVALFPMAWPVSPDHGPFSLHGFCAVSFFVCIAYVCIWRAGDTLPLIKDEPTRQRYQRTYTSLGWAMVIFPCLAWALSRWPRFSSGTFFMELAGIYVFAIYWAVKTRETSRTSVDLKAARGRVRVRSHGLADAFRPLPVSVDEPGPGVAAS
jgi:hypothetical protein